MKSIAIIPARSGSKGLKNKNIKLLRGKPLMWYSVQAAIQSGCFDEVMVSTDSEEYAKIAKECGAAVPFLRSKETSGDSISSWDSVREVLVNYEQLGKRYDYVMLLQPTSPLRTMEDIKNAFDVLKVNNAESVVGVCEMEHSPLWSNVLPESGNLQGFIRSEAEALSGRQSLPTYYRINGAIYLSKIDYKSFKFDLYNERGFAYKMPQDRSIDIDNALDFRIAEEIMKNYKEGGL